MLDHGLNPFFIRSIVQSRTAGEPHAPQVLIPSSSGQSFNPSVGMGSAAIGCLNPFFIRSIVQSQEGKCWIGYDARVLIPSSSGQSFNPPPATICLRKGSLNPFFIRSIVQSTICHRREEVGWVLIPSSSGQSFNHNGRRYRVELRVS